VQIPQLGLQHTLSILHVVSPHAWLAGYWMALSQRFWSQVAPAATHVPQLALQQTCPKLHVLGPHNALCDEKLSVACAVGIATGCASCMFSIGWGGGELPPLPPALVPALPPVFPRLPPAAAGAAALETDGASGGDAAGDRVLVAGDRVLVAGDGALVGTTGG